MLRKLFNLQDYQTIKLCVIGVIIGIFIQQPLSYLSNKLIAPIVDPPFEQWLESRHEKKRQDFQNEVNEEIKRRRAEKTDTNTAKHDSHDKTINTPTEPTHVTELPQKSSNPPSNVLISGENKGMTPEQVAAREQLKIEFAFKNKAINDKIMAAWDIRLQNTDDKKSLMLSVFKSLSPEQLKHMREESLKHLPAEKVNYFFDDVENKGSAKTDEQLIAEGDKILNSEKSLDILFRELEIEKKELLQNYEEIFGQKMFSNDE